MGLGRWVQIHRFFYISIPADRGQRKLRPFEKMAPLDDHIRKKSQQFMCPGTNVAVDECIEGFEGRLSETVTIPSKPTSTGYKM